ncbi:VCBS repeat-containing protein [Streptomyces sp. APSN-46.1]|uniref:C40 family peptidase n=1 Tax=Streptomyces sp. APSN-46.1 TaxID=2929049 RepID=UPI001FB416F3|nr:VCBS repeat-containing protein [Streptomyces sp. APSN-46.1]MCJ1680586.1 VCBS repeat-containing protein [Streptomyces sp. APSN-46.1]
MRRTAVATLLAGAVAAGMVGTMEAAAAAPAVVAATTTDNPDYGSTGQGPEMGFDGNFSASASSSTTATITRSEVIDRARTWVNIGLVYNGSATYGGYRTDCSGYVSMAWDLGTSPTTDTYESRGLVESIGKADLKAGDALLDNDSGAGGHIVLFEKWANAEHSQYYGFDFTPSGVHYRLYDYPYFSGYGPFYPVRYTNIVDDGPTTPPEPVDVGMTDLASADLSGDGVMDVVAVEVSTGKLWLYRGTSTGTIATGGSRVEIGSGGWNGMSNLSGGDFTGDGKDDIVAVEESTGKLWLYKGANNSTLTGGGSRVEIGSGGWNGMSDLTGLNLNQDGFADLVGVEKSTGKLYLYPGNGTGLNVRQEIGSGGWNGMSNLTGMDFDNDGAEDLVGVEESTGKLFVYPASTPGSLGVRKEIGSGGWNGMSDLIGGALLNANAADDLVAVEDATGKLFVYPGTGTALGARQEIGTGGW